LSSWLELLAVGLAGVTSVGSLVVLGRSQQRKLKIKSLEKQLAQTKTPPSKSSAVVKA